MKKSTSTSYQTIPWPKARTFISDFLTMGMKKHNIHGSGEFNVSRARSIIDANNIQTKERISFTAFFIHCVAKAVSEQKIMHAMKQKQKLVIFDDVDVVTVIEKDFNGHKFPQYYIVRNADKKSLRHIHEELRAAQRTSSPQKVIRDLEKFARLPRFIRKLLWRYLITHPSKKKESMGTVGVSSIGMFHRSVGWGIPITPSTLNFTLGGIYKKMMPDKEFESNFRIDEHLCYTMTVDHDIIDGAPAARFLSRLDTIIKEAESLQSLCPQYELSNIFYEPNKRDYNAKQEYHTKLTET